MSDIIWEGQSPTVTEPEDSVEWEGQAPSAKQKNKTYIDAPITPIPSTTVEEDFYRGAKDLAKSFVSKSSMAAAGAAELSNRSIFGILGNTIRDKLGVGTPTQDQIFSNMETVNKAIEESKDSGEGKDRGIGGTVIAGAPTLGSIIAQGYGSAPMAMVAGATEVYTQQAKNIAENTSTAAPALVGAIPQGAGMALDIFIPIKYGTGLFNIAAKGAATNTTVGFISDAATKGILKLFGEDKAAELYDPYDPNQRGAELVFGSVLPLAARGYAGAKDLTTSKKAKAAHDEIVTDISKAEAEALPPDVTDLASVRKETTIPDVETGQAINPYMKRKTYRESQQYADKTNQPGNRELNPTIKSKKPYFPIGRDDPAMTEAMRLADQEARIAENDAIAASLDWTGQEPGIGKGEVLQDVDTAMLKNPYLNDEQAFQAQRNVIGTPPVKEGFVRYYHGGNPENVTESLWFTSDINDAKGWASRDPTMKLWYVDIAKDDVSRGGDPEFGVLPPTRIEFPKNIAEQRALLKSPQGPGHSEMDFAMPKNGEPVFPTSPDKELFAAIKSAARAANAKGSFEKNIVKAEAAYDKIKSDIAMVEAGAEIRDTDGEYKVQEPEIHPESNEKVVEEITQKLTNGPKLKGPIARQRGHIDLSDYTGIGFRDLVDGIKRTGIRVWNSAPQEFKDKFKNAFLRNKEGVPSMLAHGTTVDYKDYDRTTSDGRLIHAGTIDAAHIIKDKNIKGVEYLNIPGLNKDFIVASFREFIAQEMKKNKRELTDKELKKVREKWQIEREKLLKLREEEGKLFIDKVTLDVLDFIKTRGIEEFAKVLSGRNTMRRGKIRATDKTLLQNMEDHFYNIIETYDFSSPDTIFKGEEIVNAIRERRKYIHNTLDRSPTPNLYIRPLFTSMENPIFIRDMGVWSDPYPLLQELLKKEHSKHEADISHGKFYPNPLLLTLPQEKAAILEKDLFHILADYIENKQKYVSNEVLAKITDRIYDTLEKQGFDGFIYENRAESINLPEVIGEPGTQTPETPAFSIATWRTDKLHDVLTISPRKGYAKSQGGYIDLDVLKESAKKVAKLLKFNKPYDHAKWLEAKANADTFETVDDLLKTYKPEDTSDLPAYGKNILTVNQAKNVMDHPWFNYVFSSVGKYKREANTRFVVYADALEDTFKLPRKDQLTLFKTLVDMQGPETKEARRMAEVTKTREQFLLDRGLDPKLVPHAIKVLDVLKHAFIKDNESTARVLREPFDLEPMYFPRAHSGKFNVVIRTKENDIKYATGFDSGKEAQEFTHNLRESYKKQIDAGELFIDVRRNHFGNSGDMFSVMALEQGVPQSIAAIASSIESNIESAKRKFELHRAQEGVPGYIGERLLDEKTYKGRIENDKLLNLLQNRLRSSHDWEIRSKIIENIKAPFFDDITFLHDKPEFRSFVGQFINRELGHDLGAGPVNRNIQKAMEDVSKAIDKYHLNGKHNYEGGDIALISPKALQQTAQAWTYVTSFLKLSLNPPVLAANATAIPLVFLDGVRSAAKQKVGIHNAITAYFDTLIYAGLPRDGATKFMQEAIKEGRVEPHISEQYDLAETGKHKEANRFDSALNYMRNQIEKGTNFTAILYYYNYYKRVTPNLKPEALKRMVYESARAYTGDYSLEAGPLMFSQAGAAGRLMSNFAKWKWNQIGRLVDDLKDAKNGHLAPVAINMATQVLVGGIYGTAGAVDYEALRRLGKALGWWDWRPFGAYFDAAQEFASKEFNINPEVSEWLRRGALTEGINKASHLVGLETSPDLSGTMRHSSALEAPTVAAVAAWDVFVQALPTGLKMLWQAAGGKTTGVTDEDETNFIRGFPTVTQGAMKYYLAIKKTHPEATWEDILSRKVKLDTPTLTNSNFNEKGIYRRSVQEQKMSLLNFRSVKENNYTDKVYYNSWEKANRTKQISDRVKGIINNQDNPELFNENISELATLGGVQTIRNIVKQLKSNEINKNLSADEQAAFAMINSLDPTRKKFMLDQMTRLLESDKTSSNR